MPSDMYPPLERDSADGKRSRRCHGEVNGQPCGRTLLSVGTGRACEVCDAPPYTVPSWAYRAV